MGDSFVERAVVLFVGAFAILGLLELGWLIDHTKIEDAAVLAIIAGPVGGALGILGTLLATVSRGGKTTPVQVMNEPKDAVPVVADPED